MLNHKHVGWGEVRTPTAVFIQPQRVGLRTSPQPTIKVMFNKKIKPNANVGWACFFAHADAGDIHNTRVGTKNMPTLPPPKR